MFKTTNGIFRDHSSDYSPIQFQYMLKSGHINAPFDFKVQIHELLPDCRITSFLEKVKMMRAEGIK